MVNAGLGQFVFIPPGATATPIPIALASDVKIDIDYKTAEARGSWTFAVEKALTEGDIKGTCKNISIQGATLAAVLAGSTTSTGSVLGVQFEQGTIPGTPFTITVANSATWVEDLGVLDFTANKWMTRVASGPITGQYSVTAGAYLFATADTGHNVGINYDYTSATIGKTTTLNNQLIGTTTTFGLRLYNANTVGGVSRYMGLQFPRVLVPKLSLSWAATKYTEQDLSFEIMQDLSSLGVAKVYTQE